MRYYWLRDRKNQQQFDIYWKPGSESEADYFTKHHPTSHHRQRRNRYVHDYITHMSSFLNYTCQLTSTSPYAAPSCPLRGCVPNPIIH